MVRVDPCHNPRRSAFIIMKTIGVFFGSRSPEHDVSIITGELIISGLKKLGYNVVPIYLDKEGRWCTDDKLGSIEFFQKADRKILPKFSRFYLDLEASRGKIVFRKKGLAGKKIIVDLAFPAFHGRFGEDGTIQGLFEILDVPYVGCDVASSAVTMDKVLTKLMYQALEIPSVPFVFFQTEDWQSQKPQILQGIKNKLKWPVFVKPSRLGSSIGIAKVSNEKELEFAIEVGLHYDEKVLVEQGVENLMDVTCAVLGNENPIPSLLQESAFSDEFFSYEEKYLKEGGAQLGRAEKNIIIPARLDPEKTKEIRNLAVQVFKDFGCSGIARVDFLYDKKEDKIYANEINTLPGTLYHHLWNKSGVRLPELLTKLIQFAESRHEKQKKLISIFESEILKQAGAGKLKLKIGDQ